MGIEIQEPFRMPDVRRPDKMPSLPVWVASRLAAAQREMQPDPVTGKWRMVLTLPVALRLTATSIAEIKVHVANLETLLGPTPEDDPDVEAEMLALIAKMMMALPAQRQDELATEASGEAFLMAVEDLPAWAVRSAYRRWCRNEAGLNARGEPYDCHWRPGPADLRSVALTELWRIKGRIEDLKGIVIAEERIEYSDEHCADMKRRLGELSRDLAARWSPDLSPRGEKSPA